MSNILLKLSASSHRLLAKLSLDICKHAAKCALIIIISTRIWPLNSCTSHSDRNSVTIKSDPSWLQHSRCFLNSPIVMYPFILQKVHIVYNFLHSRSFYLSGLSLVIHCKGLCPIDVISFEYLTCTTLVSTSLC